VVLVIQENSEMHTVHVDPSIFRAYDIRGVVGETLTSEVVELIGQAIGTEALARGEQTVIIGRDGRLSGPVLSKALCQGILNTGCHVIDIGMVPTPVLYFVTHHLKNYSGAMLTGSHNPSNYNGVKIVLGGETLSSESIQKLYQRIYESDLVKGQPGKYSREDMLHPYIAHILGTVSRSKAVKVVVDAGNGVGGLVAPELYRRLGCEVEPLYTNVDGEFPNHHPDPSHPKNLQDLIQAVRDHHADVGFAFDGDADRLGVVTNEGEIILPDRQLILFAVDALKQSPGSKVIYDVKCSRHVPALVKKHEGCPLISKTGHSYVKAKIKETGALIAGEMSGHIFFNDDRWFGFDDGSYAGARLLEILSKEEKTVSELFKAFPDSVSTNELKLAIDEDRKFTFMKQFIEASHFDGAEINTLDGIRVDFPKGWGLIRPSNTTPYLILRFEADDEAELNRIQNLFRTQLLKLDSRLEMPF